jgi:hypothetical protein
MKGQTQGRRDGGTEEGTDGETDGGTVTGTGGGENGVWGSWEGAQSSGHIDGPRIMVKIDWY